jgi:hypothetical protein
VESEAEALLDGESEAAAVWAELEGGLENV